MTQAPRNTVDLPLIGPAGPIADAVNFATRDRPDVKGKDTRNAWRKFSDWVFDGILPETQTNFYGDGDVELKEELQKKAAMQRRGGKPFIDQDEGSAQRLAADLLVGFADEGNLPLEADPADELAGDILLDMATKTIGDSAATDTERREAIEVVGERALRQMMMKQEAESELASLSNGEDLTKRIVEMYAEGKTQDEIGAELAEGGWDYSMADNRMFERLEQEVEILLDEGQLGRAKALTFARLNLMKNGGAPDVNMSPYDRLLDAYIEADTANLSRKDAFSIAGTDTFLSTIRGIGRLTGMGYTTPKDRDILEKMTAESFEKHPISSLAGSFTGGFLDPVFFGISMGAAKAPITAAQRSRYVSDLIARGTPVTLANQMGKRATMETVASNRLTKYFLNRGLSMRTAQAAGNLTWNISDAAITNAFAEGIIAAGEGVSPTEVAIRSLKGAGTGIAMGVVLDRAFRGVDKVSRVLTRKVPARTASNLDAAISYAAAQGREGQELSSQLRQLARAWDDAGDRLGRKLTDVEAGDIAESMGLRLDEIAELRKAQVQELKARKQQRKEQARAGDELTALELEAIEKGIIRAPSAEPTPAERARQAAEADAELERRYGPELDRELDQEAKDRGIIKDPEPEPKTPEERKRRADEADAELERRYGPELDAEEQAGGVNFPAKVSADELAQMQAPSADLGPNPTPEDLDASAKFQRGNLDTLEHRDDPFVKVFVPIDELDGIRTGEGEADVAQYQRLNPQSRPPIAAGPPKAGDLAEGKTLLVADGQRRAAAARANGETEIVAYVPEWYAKDKKYSSIPQRLKKLGEKAEGGEVIDRTPEGYGPEGAARTPPEPAETPRTPAEPKRTPQRQESKPSTPQQRDPEELGARGEQEPISPELAEDVAEQERIAGIGMRERTVLGVPDADPRLVGRAVADIERDIDGLKLDDDLIDGDEIDLDELDATVFLLVSESLNEQGLEIPADALDDLVARMTGRAQPILEAKLRRRLAKEKPQTQGDTDGQAVPARPDDAAGPPAPEPGGAGRADEGGQATPQAGRAGEPDPTDAPARADEPEPQAEPEEVDTPPADDAIPDNLEEVPSNQPDARYFVNTNMRGVDKPKQKAELARRRKALKERVEKAEKIAGLKNPAGKPKRPSKGAAKNIPVFKKASKSKMLIRDIFKADKSNEASVAVYNEGRTAVFSHGTSAVRVEASAWDDIEGGAWGDNGVYVFAESGPGPKKKSRITPEGFDSIFKPVQPSDNTVVFPQVDLQGLVRDAKRAMILSVDARVVIARNPDGTIAFAGSDPEYGSAAIRAQDGAVPIMAINMRRVEKMARVMQRAGYERVDLEIRHMQDTGKAPKPTENSIMVLRGDDTSAAIGGIVLNSEGAVPERFRPPEPPDAGTTAVSPGGPKSSPSEGTQRTSSPDVTGGNLDTIRGVPGDQMMLSATNNAPQSGVDPGITKPVAPDWVRQPATTTAGKKMVGRIKGDPKGMKYGVRTIAEQLTKALDPLIVRQVREQLTSRNPAHYMEMAHMVRTRSASEPNWMFHEQGHAISAIVRQVNPSFLIDQKPRLMELVEWPGSMASAKSPEEGFAEFIRRLIVSPQMMQQWPYTDGILEAVRSANPNIHDAIRDAARAYDAYMQRPIEARWRSYMNDTKARPFSAGRVISRALVDYVSRGFAPEQAMRKVMVEIRKDAKNMREGWKRVAQAEQAIKNTAADMEPAYQSLNHIGQMVNVALEGPGKVKPGEPTGLRVHATVVPEALADTFLDRPKSMIDSQQGVPDMLSLGERELLEDGGFKLPDEPPMHGDVVVLADKSIADAIKPIPKDDWPEFETYAQMKATVARIKTRAMEGKAFPYQTQGEGVSPMDLINSIRKYEKENPSWKGVFDDLEEIMASTLLLDVMSGELTVKDAISIKKRFEHYIPLTRQGEGGARAIRSGATPSPSANIRRSSGSVNPAEPLLMAMSRKVEEAVNAYYWNRFAMSPLILARTLDTMPDVPRTAKVAANRMAIPLKLDTKKLASASPEEVRKAIHAYIVEQVAGGSEMFNMMPEDLATFTPEDVGIVDGFDIWRKVPPKAVNVLAPNIRGQRRYYQILDDNLYRIFAEGGDQVNTIAKLSEVAFASATQGLKNQITQSFVFAFRSLFRDPLTAVMFGKDPEAMVPGFYHAVGAIAMMTGRKPDALVSPELMSRVFRQVTPEDFAKQRSKSMEILTEGLVPRGWRDMNALNRSLSAPGIAFRVLMKPIEIKQIATGQRALANTMETAPRLGAYIMAKKRGLSDEAAQLAADTVTGNFSERPLSSSAHSIYRTAGFLNPAFQIFGQTLRIATDPVPGRAAQKSAVIMGNVAMWTSAIWALNYLFSSPEERKRNNERTEQERLTHMDIKGFRIPFDYGILGGVQSYTWNQLDALSGQRGVSGSQIARKIVGEVLPHTSLNPLEFVPMTAKAGAEASMGYSLYRQETLEPPFMQYLEPQDRYFDTTPDLYRWVGRMADTSPIRAQYFVRNGLGVQLDDAVRLLDRIDQGLKYDELASLPEIGRAFSREPTGWNSRSVRDAADIGRKFDETRRRLQRMQEDPNVDPKAVAEMTVILDKLAPVKQAMLQIQRLYDASKDIKDTDAQRSKQLREQMVEIARESLIKMEEIEKESQQ